MCGCSNVAFQPSRLQYYDPASFGYKYKDVFFESRDGRKIHGWFFPAASESEEKGVIVQFHGNAENISTHFMSLVWVTGHGYSLFIFDYQGYGRSEGTAGHKKAYSDALGVIDYAVDLKRARQREGMDTYKTVLYGQSIGGAILLRAFPDHENVSGIDALVVDSSFPSYREIAREKLSLTCIAWPFQPLAYLLFSDRYAPAKVIKRIPPLPKLFIHGDHDMIIPIHHGERLFKLADEPKQFWRVEGGRHISAMSKKIYRERLLKFLSEL